MTLSKFKPDTPEEWHLIGRYVNNLGHSMSLVLLFAASEWWVLASLMLTWVGGSVADYFGHQKGKFDEKGNPNPDA